MRFFFRGNTHFTHAGKPATTTYCCFAVIKYPVASAIKPGVCRPGGHQQSVVTAAAPQRAGRGSNRRHSALLLVLRGPPRPPRPAQGDSSRPGAETAVATWQQLGAESGDGVTSCSVQVGPSRHQPGGQEAGARGAQVLGVRRCRVRGGEGAGAGRRSDSQPEPRLKGYTALHRLQSAANGRARRGHVTSASQ